MAATSNGKSATKKTTTKAKSTASAKSAPAATEKNQVQAVAETAVDFPVGVVLGVTDRISELVDPWTNRAAAEKQIKVYRTQLRKSIKRTERRGATARRKATTEAKKTRTRVEREARKRQRTVETTLKRNRNEVESRVRKAIDEQASRAQDLVDQVTEQLSALR
jgi:hypothetical protein